jgi:exodeoxyribonuclease V beta subunit
MIDGHRPMASFSSLTAGTHGADGGLADRHGSVGDASLDIGGGESGAVGGGGDTFDALFGFPKGARAGLFFHDLLEHWDHTGGPPDRQEALIRSKLQVHGFDARWHPAVDRFLHQLSAKRLSGSGSAFCLSEVKMAQRINEMEFYFPLMQFSAEQIKECFKKYGDAQWRDAVGPRLERIRFAPQHGFMRGFADTVFQFGEQYFLLDWKSNHLGHKAANYDPPALDKCMLEEDYFLQYHLYTIALNRLLAQKIPGYHYERHFGGVFYIFLRGITADPADNSGLYFAKPDALLISALDDLMIAEAH